MILLAIILWTIMIFFVGMTIGFELKKYKDEYM